MDDHDRRILMGRYEIGRQLGQGSFAKVYYGRNLRTGLGVAIKMIDKERVLQGKLIEQIKREITVMRLARHPNIIQLYEVMASRSKIYFILEYAKGGELFNKVAKGKLKEELARKYFQQLISAIDYCHSRGVYHRDLKPENCLMDENENLKVSDFGLSALYESRREDGLLHTTCGTPAYVAPEVLGRKGYDGAKADIWSCGVILYVLVAGYLPFHDRNLVEMYRKISKAEYKFPKWFSPELRDLLFRILDPDPSTRLPISKIRKMVWFRKPVELGSPKGDGKEKAALARDNPSTSASEAFTDADIGWKAMSLPHMNAFDIISMSSGFDLSGLFEGPAANVRKEAKFTSKQPPAAIIEALLSMANRLKLRVGKNAAGSMKMVTPREGRKGPVEIDAEVFEVAPSVHLVEMRKAHGDSFEFNKLMKQEIAPALRDVVWAWDGSLQQIMQQQMQQEEAARRDQQAAVQPREPAEQDQSQSEQIQHGDRNAASEQEQIRPAGTPEMQILQNRTDGNGEQQHIVEEHKAANEEQTPQIELREQDRTEAGEQQQTPAMHEPPDGEGERQRAPHVEQQQNHQKKIQNGQLTDNNALVCST